MYAGDLRLLGARDGVLRARKALQRNWGRDRGLRAAAGLHQREGAQLFLRVQVAFF